MNINNDHSTLKNLKKKKPNYLYEYLVDFDISKNFEYKNSGGLRAKGFFKSFIPNKPLISIITVCLNSEYTSFFVLEIVGDRRNPSLSLFFL